MRRTTELLMAHLPIHLALLIEECLGAKNSTKKEEGDYFNIILGGHRELIDSGICQENAEEMMRGAAATSDIDMLDRSFAFVQKNRADALTFAINFRADNKMITYLVRNVDFRRNNLSFVIGMEGDLRIIRHIVSLNVHDYQNIFLGAMNTGSVSVIHWILNQGIDVDWNTSMHWAGAGGQKAMCQICLQNGGDIDEAALGACSLDLVTENLIQKKMQLLRYLANRGDVSFDMAYMCAEYWNFEKAIEFLDKII